MRAAIDRLGERDREVLVLRHLEQLPMAEVAGVLEISLASCPVAGTVGLLNACMTNWKGTVCDRSL